MSGELFKIYDISPFSWENNISYDLEDRIDLVSLY